MKKKNGFTLVELLAVIVILALLMVIAIPNAQKMSQNVKEKSYSTKIDNIENAAKMYGENLGSTLSNSDNRMCIVTNSDKEIKYICEKDSEVRFKDGDSIKADKCDCNNENFVPVRKEKIITLAKKNYLSFDSKNQYSKLDTNNNHSDLKEFYDNVVTSPVSDYVINLCNVYIYYKYHSVYAWFDRETCESERKNDLIKPGEEDKINVEYSNAPRLFLN